MGHGQINKCKHCGATFNRYCGVGLFGQESENADERVDQIETNKPICCPECGERLNNSPKEFEEQIQSIFLWD